MKLTPHTYPLSAFTLASAAPSPPPPFLILYNPLPSSQHQSTYALCNGDLAVQTKPSPINRQPISDSPHRSRVANHDRSENFLGSGYKIKGPLFFLHFIAFTFLYNGLLRHAPFGPLFLEGENFFAWEGLDCEVGLSGLMWEALVCWGVLFGS